MINSLQYANTIYESYYQKKILEAETYKELPKSIEEITDEKINALVERKIIEFKMPKRYAFKQYTYKEKFLREIFQYSFQENPESIIQISEQLDPSLKTSYSKYRKFTFIALPLSLSNMLKSKFLKICITIAFVFRVIISLRKLYRNSDLLIGSMLPKVINNTPLSVIRMYNVAMQIKDYCKKHFPKIVFISFLIRFFLFITSFNPPSIIAGFLHGVNNIRSISPVSLFSFLFETSFNSVVFIWGVSNNIESFFTHLASRENQNRLSILKQKCGQLWIKTFMELEIVKTNA